MNAPTVTSVYPMAGRRPMRTPVYLLAIGSCLVLSWLFATRENWIGLVLVLVGAVSYGARLATANRADRREALAAAREQRPGTSAEQQALRTELGQLREAYERNRRVMLLIAVVIAGLATIAWAWNPALALALLLFAIPCLALAWRSTRAVRRIDRGLAAVRRHSMT